MEPVNFYPPTGSEGKIRVGIPRGLFYYRYFAFWKAFFEEMGVEIVVSPPTDKETLAQGIFRLAEEVCLPVKAFCGHVISLKDRCDFILIPSIFSLERKVYHCPKFIGLPDLMRAVVPESPPILDPTINLDKGEKDLYLELYKLAGLFSSNLSKIRKTIEEMIRSQEGFGGQARPEEKRGQANIALIGHPYLLYDAHLNHHLVWHLEGLGMNILFPDMVPKEEARRSLYKINPSPYWACEDEIIGAGAYFIEREDVDGLILLSAFGCGPDSTMHTFLENYARRSQRPTLGIVLDEHTAEAGLITRIEAFVDTILENKRRRISSLPNLSKETFIEDRKKIRILGAPYMGGRLKIFRRLFEKNFGISLALIPVTSRTFGLGVRHSPEFICFPFKVILGNFIECLEKGADTLIMISSFGPCRIGYYRRLLEEILGKIGYKFELFKLKSEDKGVLGVLRTIKRFSNDAPWLRVLRVFLMGVAKLKALDKIEREVQKIRAREMEKNKADQIFEEAIEAIDQAEGLRDLNEVKRKYLERLRKIPKEDIQPLKIGLIGEIFVLMEPFVNMEIERGLGRMGVEVERVRSTYLSEYVNLLHPDVLSDEKKALERFTRRYLKRDVGGHGLESIGKKIVWSRDFDGLIHIMPFGCLPEVIAQNIMARTEEKIPVLTIACDEKLGKAGLITRLEAFVDLLQLRMAH